MARPQKRAEQARAVLEPHEALQIPAIPADAWLLAPSPVRLADGAFAPVDSPARALQSDLAASLYTLSDADQRWSARRSLAVITVASLLGWAGLIFTARMLLS